MRRWILTLMVLAGFCHDGGALSLPLGIELPRDPVNIELAIDFHKAQIDLLNCKISDAEIMRRQQAAVTNKTSKLDKVMDQLHDRERGVMNWLYFANNLNEIRMNFQKIYNLETLLLDYVDKWAIKAPAVNFKSLGGIKATYKDLGVKSAVLVIAYDAEVKFIDETKALYKLFSVQFGGEVMDNTFSGKMKNLTVNMATDLQRRKFTQNILTKQGQIIDNLDRKIGMIRYTVLGYYKLDYIGAALDYLDKENFYKGCAERVERTFYENIYI